MTETKTLYETLAAAEKRLDDLLGIERRAEYSLGQAKIARQQAAGEFAKVLAAVQKDIDEQKKRILEDH